MKKFGKKLWVAFLTGAFTILSTVMALADSTSW